MYIKVSEKMRERFSGQPTGDDQLVKTAVRELDSLRKIRDTNVSNNFNRLFQIARYRCALH